MFSPDAMSAVHFDGKSSALYRFEICLYVSFFVPTLNHKWIEKENGAVHRKLKTHSNYSKDVWINSMYCKIAAQDVFGMSAQIMATLSKRIQKVNHIWFTIQERWSKYASIVPMNSHSESDQCVVRNVVLSWGSWGPVLMCIVQFLILEVQDL